MTHNLIFSASSTSRSGRRSPAGALKSPVGQQPRADSKRVSWGDDDVQAAMLKGQQLDAHKVIMPPPCG